MAETHYCYHCARHHPTEEMTLYQTKHGQRWRCKKSIAAAKGSQAQRDQFGSRVSAENTRLTKEFARRLSDVIGHR